jgi:hypothetical protein
MTESEERSDVTTQNFDQERAEAFAERLVDVLNSASIALMTSIGHRTGLFDAMAGLPPPPATRSLMRPTSTSATSANGSPLWW